MPRSWSREHSPDLKEFAPWNAWPEIPWRLMKDGEANHGRAEAQFHTAGISLSRRVSSRLRTWLHSQTYLCLTFVDESRYLHVVSFMESA